MFGKKKQEAGTGEQRQSRDQRGYYRQEDYYTQHPAGGSYYDANFNAQEDPRRRDYARPGYDRRYVNTPENGNPYYGTGSGRRPDGRERDPYNTAGGPQTTGRRGTEAPYMENGYGERIYDPGVYAGGRSGKNTGGAYRREGGSRYTRREEGNSRYASAPGQGRRGGYNAYPQGPGGGYYDERPRRRRKKRRVWLFILEILIVLLLAAGVFAFAQLGRIGHTKLKDIITNSGLGSMSGYTNIVLYGVDSRTGELTHDCHSDTIMILSMNRRTKEVRIASVYRDTYLDNTNGEFRKATECYFYGGPERSVNMLNKNLDLNIKDYVAVNFNAVVAVIDMLGGIDLEITDEEMQYINGYCVENQQVTGVSYTPLSTSGYVHLDGIQALAYCRIRYTEGWDFKRTERQRTVLTNVYQKAVKQGIPTLMSIANTMLPQISTSMSSVDILGLVTGIGRYKVGEQTGFPFDMTPADLAAGDCVVPVNLTANVSQLHAFLFDENGYTPSQTVQEISNEIIANTGIG